MANDIVLIESRSAREQHLCQMPQDKAQRILEKVKGILFALWRGEGIATTAKMAEFYEVSEDTIQTAIKNHRDEFESDGLKVLSGKPLREVVSIIDISSMAPKLTVWNPRAALRLGMLLRDSLVAKQVRTTVLDLVEHGIPAQAERIKELELALALERERNLGKQLDNTLLQLHGKETVLTLRGHKDQLVKSDPIVVVEVVDQATGTTERIIGAEELRRVVKRRTGQTIKTMRELTDRIRAAGRDDLLVPVKRQHTTEYLTPQTIEEALEIAFGSQRQALIGE